MKTAETIFKELYMKLPNASEQDWDDASSQDSEMHQCILSAMEEYANQFVPSVEEKEVKQLLEFLAKHGGNIISSNDLHSDLIAQARASNRMYVDENSLGYIWEPPFAGRFPVTEAEVEMFEWCYPIKAEFPESLKADCEECDKIISLSPVSTDKKELTDEQKEKRIQTAIDILQQVACISSAMLKDAPLSETADKKEVGEEIKKMAEERLKETIIEYNKTAPFQYKMQFNLIEKKLFTQMMVDFVSSLPISETAENKSGAVEFSEWTTIEGWQMNNKWDGIRYWGKNIDKKYVSLSTSELYTLFLTQVKER